MKILMNDENTRLIDFYYEHELWSNKIRCWREEISIYLERIKMLLENVKDEDLRSALEYFGNEFNTSRGKLEELRTRADHHQLTMCDFEKDKELDIENLHLTDHAELKEKVKRFENKYSEIKLKFERQTEHD